jgi:hypothetical protein
MPILGSFGAGSKGGLWSWCKNGGPGGNGLTSSITGSPVTRAGGGGGAGGYGDAPGGSPGSGGSGGGAPSGPSSGGGAGPSAPANTGGGGGGGGWSSGPAPGQPVKAGGSGGSGFVVIRRVTADSCGSGGTPTPCGADTIHTFTGPGTYTA